MGFCIVPARYTSTNIQCANYVTKILFAECMAANLDCST